MSNNFDLSEEKNWLTLKKYLKNSVGDSAYNNWFIKLFYPLGINVFIVPPPVSEHFCTVFCLKLLMADRVSLSDPLTVCRKYL